MAVRGFDQSEDYITGLVPAKHRQSVKDNLLDRKWNSLESDQSDLYIRISETNLESSLAREDLTS